jgi:hypothetical protein
MRIDYSHLGNGKPACNQHGSSLASPESEMTALLSRSSEGLLTARIATNLEAEYTVGLCRTE